MTAASPSNNTPDFSAVPLVFPVSPEGRGGKVLVVDDTRDNLAVAGSILLEHGYEVFVADSGECALEMVEVVAPDLILLDLMMPGMDGIETCQRLKDRPATRHIPVIILTASDNQQSLLNSFAAGAVDYVSKPFNPAVLLARAATHVQLYRRTRELQRLVGIDALTGLPNRRAFDERIEDEWRRAGRTGGVLGLLLLDVDWFKQFNDGYGHQHGDVALRAVADAVQAEARRVIDFSARYGGEEFVVLTLGDKKTRMEVLAQHIIDGVRALAIPHGYGDAGPILTVSVGCACVVPASPMTPLDLFDAADAALYRAKKNGRNRKELGLVSTSAG